MSSQIGDFVTTFLLAARLCMAPATAQSCDRTPAVTLTEGGGDLRYGIYFINMFN